MRKVLIAMTAALAVFAAACGSEDGAGGLTDGPTITVGSANFTESIILGEIYAQALEAEGYDVEKRLNLGARDVYYPALTSGEIDLLPEYTGALARYVTEDEAAATTDPQGTYDNLAAALAEDDVTALEYASAQDKDGVVVNATTAEEYGLSTFSDLEPVAGELIMGALAECDQTGRLCGQLAANGIEFAELRSMDATTAIRLLNANEIQAANLFSTDGRIAENDFVSLEDDLGIVPVENIVPVVRDEIVDEYGSEFTDLLNSVTEQITTEMLIELNGRVDREVDPADPEDVAADWLESEGFVEEAAA